VRLEELSQDRNPNCCGGEFMAEKVAKSTSGYTNQEKDKIDDVLSIYKSMMVSLTTWGR
jgi:hypothetical protein